MNYSLELKEALPRRMLPSNNESITKISREEGIFEWTFCNWQDKQNCGTNSGCGDTLVVEQRIEINCFCPILIGQK